MTKTLTFLILMIVLMLNLGYAQEKNETPVTTDTTNQATINDNSYEQNIEGESNIPDLTPWWQWVLLGIFGSSGFGMLLNKRFAGFVVFGIILIITIIKIKTALEYDFAIWPFWVLGGWILLTGKMAQIANRQVLKKQSNQRSNGSGAANQLINKAYDEIDRKNYEKAKGLLEKSFKIDNTIPEAHSEYAFVMSILRHLDFAIDHMIQAALLVPNEPKFWTNLAFQYYNDRQYKKAMTSTFIAEIVNASYPSISQSKQMIAQDYYEYNSNITKCKERAKNIFNTLNNPDDGLPPQSGDINQLMNPDNNFFL